MSAAPRTAWATSLRAIVERERDLGRWEQILPLYGELQADAAADAGRLAALGAPARPLALLRGQYDAHLWRLPRAGGEAKQLTFTQNWHEWSFALSPRGDTVFVESGRYGGADLYLLALDSLRPTRLTQTPRLNEFSVAWSGDGRTRVWVVGQNGADTVMAGTGDDHVDGGAGSDTLNGNEGNDTIYGGDGMTPIVQVP